MALYNTIYDRLFNDTFESIAGLLIDLLKECFMDSKYQNKKLPEGVHFSS